MQCDAKNTYHFYLWFTFVNWWFHHFTIVCNVWYLLRNTHFFKMYSIVFFSDSTFKHPLSRTFSPRREKLNSLTLLQNIMNGSAGGVRSLSISSPAPASPRPVRIRWRLSSETERRRHKYKYAKKEAKNLLGVIDANPLGLEGYSPS